MMDGRKVKEEDKDGDEGKPGTGSMSAIEARRLANIRRNQQMLAALNLPSLSAAVAEASPKTRAKRKAAAHPAAKKPPRKVQRLPRRRSNRVRGLTPDGTKSEAGYKPVELYRPPSPPRHIRPEGPLTLKQALGDEHEEEEEAAAAACVKQLRRWNAAINRRSIEHKVKAGRDLTRLSIAEEHVVKVVPHRVFSMVMHPTVDKPVAFVGDKWGNVGIWSPHDICDEEETGATVFHPHARPVSGMAFHPAKPTCLYSCSYDGSVRAFDVEAERFDEVHIDEDDMFSSLSMTPSAGTVWVSARVRAVVVPWCGMAGSTKPDGNNVLDQSGELVRIDVRSKASATAFQLHERKVTCVTAHPESELYFATSSLDRTVAVWDVRKLHKTTSKPVMSASHSLGISGVSFSPSGDEIVTTSNDNTLRVTHWQKLGSKAAPKPVVIRHNNHTGRWLTPFKAIFDPANTNCVVVGNMTRGLDLYDATTGRLRTTLRDDLLTAVPTRSVVHAVAPWIVSSTASGRLYLWQ